MNNFLNRFITRVNFYGVECLIQIDSCNTSVNNIGKPNPLCDIRG